MKNIIKISFIAVVFLAVSCNKEVIRPNAPADSSTNTDVFVSKCSTNKSPDQSKPMGEPGITDPNNDPDMIIKKVVVVKPN